MGFYVNGGEDISLAGVTIRESGGDGITVASTIGKNKAGAARRLLIRDVVLDRNYRQARIACIVCSIYSSLAPTATGKA